MSFETFIRLLSSLDCFGFLDCFNCWVSFAFQEHQLFKYASLLLRERVGSFNRISNSVIYVFLLFSVSTISNICTSSDSHFNSFDGMVMKILKESKCFVFMLKIIKTFFNELKRIHSCKLRQEYKNKRVCLFIPF
jgi:hypothetical protein